MFLCVCLCVCNVIYICSYYNYVFCRHKKCVQKLLEAGADIRLQDYDGQTAVKQFTLSNT